MDTQVELQRVVNIVQIARVQGRGDRQGCVVSLVSGLTRDPQPRRPPQQDPETDTCGAPDLRPPM